jgi:TIR domain
MTRPIFLSYRRSDSAAISGRLYDAIKYRFGAESIYMDTAFMAWGEEWPTALENAIHDAEVVVVVIGPGWLTAHDEWGRRRLDREDDWVRREIELALAADKAILPLVIGTAQMPPHDALPPAIGELASRHALRLTDDIWDQQVDVLLRTLESHLPEAARRVEETDVEMAATTTTVREDFQAMSSLFYGASVETRMAAAEEVAGIAGLLDLEDVLEFARSGEAAERVGAAIALSTHLRMSEGPREDARVQAALRALLNDDRSRVRYRAAEVLRGFPALASMYQADLRWRAEHDENAYVRRMATRALRRAGVRR